MIDQQREPGTRKVPDGCSLEAYGPSPAIPSVSRLRGGMLMASMGVATDQPGEDMDRLLQLVDQALREGGSEILLSEAQHTDDLFSADTPTRSFKAMVWMLNPLVFATWREGAALLQRLLQHWVDDLRVRELAPIVYVPEPRSPVAAGLIRLLGDLGFGARGPQSSNGAAVLVAQRADGVVVTALAGESFAPGRGALRWHAELNRRRHQARKEGRKGLLGELDQAQRDYLEQRLAPLRTSADRAVEWAPRLRALTAQAPTGGESAYRNLLDHLQKREAHLVILAQPQTRNVDFKTAADGTPMLEVFPDYSSARGALTRRGAGDAMGLGALSTRELFLWMAQKGAGLALWMESPDEQPRFVHIKAELVRALSPG
jgi:hypothetical protein